MYKNGSPNKNKAVWSLFFIFISLSISILISSFAVSQYQKGIYETEQKEFLLNVSKLKSDEISNWYKERLNDSKSILHNLDLITTIKKIINKQDDLLLRKKLEELVDTLSMENGYSGISILDSQFNTVFKSGIDTCSKNALQLLNKVFSNDGMVTADINKSELDNSTRINFIIPTLKMERSSINKPKGIMICTINPVPFFNSLAESQLITEKNIKYCILKRMNDSLVCLNGFYYEENAESAFKLSVLLKELTSKKIINNKSIIDHGIDNNEKDMIFCLQEVDGTPFYLFTKTDANKSYGSIKISSIYINAITLLSIISLGAGLGFYWKLRSKVQAEDGSEQIFSETNNYKIKENEIKHNALFETMLQGVICTDKNGIVIEANPAAEKILGLSLDEMKKQTIYNEIWQAVKLDGSNYNINDNPIMKAIKSGQDVKNAIMGIYNPQKNKQCWIILNSVPQFENGCNEPYRVYSTFEDITERLSYDEQIKDSLIEKELLLKEIHHRVKNNFQIIISLLNLTGDFLNDKKSQEIFTDMQTRVRSMALIHELMYRQESFSVLNIKDYIENMVNFLIPTYIDTRDRIKVICNIDNLKLNMDTIIPCGLIVNELFTNSLKHAFPNGSAGCICITFMMKNDRYILSISDDGVGIPEEFDVQNLKSFGLKLVNINARQLKGELNIIKKEKGVEFKIEFGRLYHEQ